MIRRLCHGQVTPGFWARAEGVPLRYGLVFPGSYWVCRNGSLVVCVIGCILRYRGSNPGQGGKLSWDSAPLQPSIQFIYDQYTDRALSLRTGRWYGEVDRNGHPVSYAEAKKMKLLTLHSLPMAVTLRDCSSSSIGFVCGFDINSYSARSRLHSMSPRR